MFPGERRYDFLNLLLTESRRQPHVDCAGVFPRLGLASPGGGERRALWREGGEKKDSDLPSGGVRGAFRPAAQRRRSWGGGVPLPWTRRKPGQDRQMVHSGLLGEEPGERGWRGTGFDPSDKFQKAQLSPGSLMREMDTGQGPGRLEMVGTRPQ